MPIVQHCWKALPQGWANRKTLPEAADSIYRNRARTHSEEYLASGWPIARGSVEGACKNLIKDRMERPGMRWVEEMAEAIVQLRAMYFSGDFDAMGLSILEKRSTAFIPTPGPSY
jgi:hypothetical protein